MTHARALQKALRSEADTVFRKLRDIAAPSGTPFEHQSIGYAFGYVEAMLEKGHVEEARDKLDRLKNALARTGHTRRGVPYLGGPYDGEIDAIDVRRGGSNESGRYVLTEVRTVRSQTFHHGLRGEDGRERQRRPVMKSRAPDYDAWYSRTPSQAEGERDETGEGTATEQHPDVPRSEPSQAEGERGDDT
ncbi:hypothetical protein ACF1A5_05930 [Streptomyces sp. NPDC014864]|uniref:hypothetical protein n=2 Tax=unclassified Streptomyces TaxID=2593676 RepID=UPI0036FB5BDD